MSDAELEKPPTTSQQAESPSGVEPPPAPKKAKRMKKSAFVKRNFQIHPGAWPLGDGRFVRLVKYRGTLHVNIRDYHSEKDRNLKRKWKGVLLTLPQWDNLQDAIPKIDEAIERQD